MPDALLPVVVVVAVAGVLVAADRLVARYWPADRGYRPRTRGSGAGAGMFAELVAGFQPGYRHQLEEQERQRHDLVLPGDADPPWALDLVRGTAHVGGRRPRLTEVAPGVWTAGSQLYATRTTVIVGRTGACLVVDPGVTVAEIAALAAELTARGWIPVAGFSTHPHWDHVLWHRTLGAGPRWATPTAVVHAAAEHDELCRSADDDAPGHDHDRTGRLTAVEGAELDWDGPRAVVVPYPGHCPGSAALALPDAGVLIAGDVLSDVEIPLLDLASADPVGDHRRGLDVLERTVARYRLSTVVPGHGSVGDAAELSRRFAADRAYLEALARGEDPVDDRVAASSWLAAEHERQRTALRR